jgi:hypothetical protein
MDNKIQYKLVNGFQVEMKENDINEIKSFRDEWEAGALDRAMAKLRQRRNSLLTETDWVVLPDSPIADKTAWETYRTQLRDITNGLTTVEQVEAVVFPTKPN